MSDDYNDGGIFDNMKSAIDTWSKMFDSKRVSEHQLVRWDSFQWDSNDSPNATTRDESFVYRNIVMLFTLMCLILSLIVAFLVLSNWICRSVARRRRGRRHILPHLTWEAIEGRRVPHLNLIRALNTTRIEKWTVENGRFSNNVSCVICLDEFVGGEVVRKLNCEHVFHVNCVDNWIRLKMTCPICNQRLTARRSSQIRMKQVSNPSLEHSQAETAILLGTPTSTEERTEPLEQVATLRPQDVHVEYFQESHTLNGISRRELIMDYPVVPVTPVPIITPIPKF